jgi:lipoprotein-anchoring transpeptidase ErfK/SrfK
MRDSNQNQNNLTRIFAIVIAATLSSMTAPAQTNQAPQAQLISTTSQLQKPAGSTPLAKTVSQRLIVVSIPDRKLVLVEAGVVKRVYPVAVGKTSTPSPSGRFIINVRVSNPTYSHHGKVIAPGPKNPVGSRWMGLSTKGYGIHGTNEPGSIGKAASHGCIRMGKADLEDLFGQVQVGDAVEIHAQHDAEVNQVLNEAVPSLPPAPAQVAVTNAVLLAGNAAAQSATATVNTSGQN